MSGQALTGVPHDEQETIRTLIDLLKENNLVELELEREGLRIRLRREPSASTSPSRVQQRLVPHDPLAEGQPSIVPADTSSIVTIRSPIVGTFYRAPSPDAEPYVHEGDVVTRGQVLCVIEAMKLMNEIESEVTGRVVKVLVESAKPVEYGQPLFLIETSSESGV